MASKRRRTRQHWLFFLLKTYLATSYPFVKKWSFNLFEAQIESPREIFKLVFGNIVHVKVTEGSWCPWWGWRWAGKKPSREAGFRHGSDCQVTVSHCALPFSGKLQGELYQGKGRSCSDSCWWPYEDDANEEGELGKTCLQGRWWLRHQVSNRTKSKVRNWEVRLKDGKGP